MSWSCPFHAVQPPLHVPDIFSVCPLHFPCMSRSFVASHFPTSVAPIGFLVRCFPFLPPALPCFHFCPLHVPFSSPFSPFMSRRFPVMSTSYVLPSFPCTSLHFPFAPQYFHQKTRFCPDFRQKEAGTPVSCFLFPVRQRVHVWTQPCVNSDRSHDRSPQTGTSFGTPLKGAQRQGQVPDCLAAFHQQGQPLDSTQQKRSKAWRGKHQVCQCAHLVL